MPVLSADFISEASNSLCRVTPVEMDYRNSISRAYYGLYHAALDYADCVSLPPVSDLVGPTHEKLRAFYCNNLSSDNSLRLLHRKVGYILLQAHQNRVLADYDTHLDVDSLLAESHLARCKNAITEIVRLSASAVA